MFVKGDVYDGDDGGVWTVSYEGLSCCGVDSVSFSGHINGVRYGKTLDRLQAYQMRADGKLRRRGQLDLFTAPSNSVLGRNDPSNSDTSLCKK